MNIRVIPVHKLCLEFCQFARVFTKVNEIICIYVCVFVSYQCPCYIDAESLKHVPSDFLAFSKFSQFSSKLQPQSYLSSTSLLV
ncbi:hypothetical protein PHAVU_009G013300 [Phaseolus vulgaris]|uniref:Uncharacterized protein n=1 Tax=Phaseolus vulgaris TaxID=3885 RepID=V7AR39_PHAVU|nr:hypothetical protein PHAVU_009G013300g [Phaseolus vulgaris]ESW08039.1 hypothetical protein PHAVU_009G013300g [Phaseolus vulgaris]